MDTEPQSSANIDRGAHTVVQEFEWAATESASTAVVRAVAAFATQVPTDLPLLTGAVDPDALDALVSDDPASPAQDRIQLRFRYAGYLVEVTSNREGRLYDQD